VGGVGAARWVVAVLVLAGGLGSLPVTTGPVAPPSSAPEEPESESAGDDAAVARADLPTSPNHRTSSLATFGPAQALRPLSTRTPVPSRDSVILLRRLLC
jgi:hypothetical protein